MTDAPVAGKAGQEAYVASTRGEHAAPGTSRAAAAESPELSYLRQTRNATVFIAVVVGIVCVLTLVGAIVVGVQLSNLNANLRGGGGAASSCASLGGTDPSC
jgi:hypothetical protein